jgi:glutamate 5-kinase
LTIVSSSQRLTVLKIGTSSITTPDGKLDEQQMVKLVDQISNAIMREGNGNNKIILVTSGAVAAGRAELDLPPRPNDIVFQQASAAIGQGVLMAKYRDVFKNHGLKVAQVLLTAEDLSNRASYLHTRRVLDWLLRIGVVPIINENDVTSVDELKPVTQEQYKINFSDNDILSALVACAVKADLLIMLSDVDGLYTEDPNKNPGADIIKVIDRITPELKSLFIGSKKSRTGRGGIQSKIKAAEIVTKNGISAVIANSRRENIVLDILSGEEGAGTYFSPNRGKERVRALKMWMAYGATIKGRIFVNEGAKSAVIAGSSLLPVGITRVSGHFKAGEVVDIVDQSGQSEFAKGNPNYNSDEINLIKGLQVSDIKAKLGYIRTKEVIERKKIHLVT